MPDTTPDAHEGAATRQPPRTIIRTVKDRAHPYAIINNTVFNDRALGWKAKGLMGYFLSKPDDWRISVADLVARGGDGAKAVYSGLRELVTAGYVHRSSLRDAAGRIRCWEYVVYEKPQPLRQNGEVDGTVGAQPSHPHPGFRHVGLRHVGNATQPSTDPNQGLRDNKQLTAADVRRRASRARARGGRQPSAVPPSEAPASGRPLGIGTCQREAGGEGRRAVAATEQAPAVAAPGDVLVHPHPDQAPDAPQSQAGRDALPDTRGQCDPASTAPCAVAQPSVPVGHLASANQAPSGRDCPPVVAGPGETPAVPAPPADPAADRVADISPTGVGDLQAICDAYVRATGLADLAPEALRGIARRRTLSPAYVAAKLALLQTALAKGEVRHARGFFLAALERDWSEQTAPANSRHSPEPAGAEDQDATSGAPDLVAALTGVGVTPETAVRLVRDHPDGVQRQLLWLPHRRAHDPAALLVRAVAEDWPEPPAAREARSVAAARAEAEQWSASMDRAREEASRPESRQVGRQALAEIRRMLGLGEARG